MTWCGKKKFMNYETNLPDPTLRFLFGVQKGRALDDAGDYKIVTEPSGLKLAQFRNGARTLFYMDPAFKPVEEKVVGGFHEIPIENTTHACDFPPDPEIDRDILCDEEPEPKILQPKQMVNARYAKYRNQDGHPANPCYVLLHAGTPSVNFTRLEVGEGTREYLWLYAKNRALGYGRMHSAWIAFELYYL
jgi:hypothetical protein